MTELGKNIGLSGQCFPVRSLTRPNGLEDGVGGAWLVAYKAEQRRRFKAVLCREPDVSLPTKSISSVSKRSFKTSKTDEDKTRKKLDGFYLVNVYHIDDPLDLCSINICGKELNQVNEEDFSLFKNVIHIDAGENNLQLRHFRKFPSLKELELPLNSLSGNININEKDFLKLETLDLSCNNLTSNDILALGILPALKNLHLTGNHLNELPSEMSRSYLSSEEGMKRKQRFVRLEELWLDQNELTNLNTFTTLAGLKRLQYLNLENNDISFVPQLKLLDPKTKLHLNNGDDKSYLQSNPHVTDEDSKLTLEPIPNIDEVLDSELADISSKISSLEKILYYDNGESKDRPKNTVEEEAINFVRKHMEDVPVLPFPSLRHLNLANNHITEEEGLLALSTWPRLEELLIYGNPVASCGKGGPPVVAYHLGLLAGIEVTRHKPSKKPKNLTSLVHIKHPRRVQDLPPVTHNRKLLMLDAPKYHEIAHDMSIEIRPLPPISAPHKERKHKSTKRVSSAPAREQNTKEDGDVSENYQEDSVKHLRTKLRSAEFHRPIQTQGQMSNVESPGEISPRQSQASSLPEDRVFLTQVDDLDNEEPLFYNDVDTQKTEEKPVDDVPKPANLPKKYKGYEELLNIDENVIDDIELPTGIHSNVRALQYTLEHPLVFTEHSGKHYRRRKTKRNKQRALSTPKSYRTTTVEELGTILDKMRTHSKTVESNLGDVLKGSDNPRVKKDIKEAKKLLHEVQTKYNEVRCQSLSSTAMAAEITQRELLYSSPANQGDKPKTCRENEKINSTNDLEKFKERLDSRI